MRKVFVFTIILLLLIFAVGFIYESIDDSRALKYAQSLPDSKVSFNPQADYSRVNGVADQFNVPLIVWSSRTLIFHKGFWRYSKSPFFKFVTFDETGKPHTVIGQFTDSSIFLKSDGTFDKNVLYPFTELGNFSDLRSTLVRGTKLRPTIVTGAPKVFPNDGMIITPSLLFASKHASQITVGKYLVNKLQLPLYSTIFPIDTTYVYK